MSFGDSHVIMEGQTSSDVGECVLEENEYITRVDVDHTHVKETIKFITTRKTCGPFGPMNENAVTSYEGRRLLFMFGRKGARFDKISFAFIC